MEEGAYNKKKLLIISIGVIAIMAILTKLWVGTSSVKLEIVKEIQVDRSLEGKYWHMVDENRIEYLERFNLSPL